MKSEFPGYYRPSPSELDDLWKHAVFVFDTNVLLNLYRYPQAARDDLLRILTDNASRVWIPHQVALEYQEQRLNVIAEQVKRFDDVRKVVSAAQGKLGTDLAQLQLAKRHSSINPQHLIEAIERSAKEFLDELELLERSQPDVHSDDQVRAQLDLVFAGRIGPAPEGQKWLDDVYLEGKTRFESKCPPGYMDAAGKKEKEEESVYWYAGMAVRRRYGDLILWKQLLHTAREKKFTRVIFVTDDETRDWWWKVDSRGEKSIGPRPELVEEIRREAGVELFYMYNSERFLEYAGKLLGARVKKESLDQVREVTSVRRLLHPREFQEKVRRAESAVQAWLARVFPHGAVLRNPRGFPDYVVEDASGKRAGFEVKTVRHIGSMMRLMQEVGLRAYYEVSQGNLESVTLVAVAESPEAADLISRDVQRWQRRGPQLDTIVGWVTGEGERSVFVPAPVYSQMTIWTSDRIDE